MTTTQTTKTIKIVYYAILKDHRGIDSENWQTETETLEALWKELQEKHGLPLQMDQLRVAVNDEIADWQAKLKTNDVVVFLPPVAGG